MTREEEGDTRPSPLEEETRLLPSTANSRPETRPVAHAAPSGTVVGEYELVRVIGEGGFGVVYEAKDRVLLQNIALKEYMPASLATRNEAAQVKVRSERFQEAFDHGMRSFINEARLLAKFDHPSLVKAYRFWKANGTAYMVMPLYRGSTLKQRLKAIDHRPSEEWLMALLDPLTEALDVLHAEKCFHRDIAPDNILLLEGNERPVLLDFGAARQVIGDMTQTLTAILKPGFAPVEQYADSPDMVQGPWTDIYALAATVHFAITGTIPPAAVGRLIEDKFVPLGRRHLDGYTPKFLAALDRALGVKPRERTASVAEFRADLGLPSLGERTIRVSQVALKEHRAQGPERSKPNQLLTFCGLGVLAVGAVGAAMWWASSKPEPAAKDAAVPPAPVPAIASPAASVAAVQPSGTASSAPALPALPAESTVATSARGAQQISDEIRAEFKSIVAAQTSGFVVEASAAKPILTIDKDRFSWRIRSEREGWLHILALGPDSTLLLLFPNRADRNNRVRTGETVNLPRGTWPLGAAEPPGREEFLIFVSDRPRVFDGLGQGYVHSFLRLPTGAAADSIRSNWPHKSSWMMGAVANCSEESCLEYGAAVVSVEVRR